MMDILTNRPEAPTRIARPDMRRLVLLLALGLLVAGCVSAATPAPRTFDDGSSPLPTDGPKICSGASAGPDCANYQVPTGPNDLVMRIETAGGLVPPGYLLTALPSWALYGDGRIIVPGPRIQSDPYQLLPDLRVMRVTPEEIQKIVAAADEAGLLGPDTRYDATGIMDAGTTVFTTVVDGTVHRISAYALFEGVETTDQATADARAKLLAFETKVFGLTEFLGRPVDDSQAYRPATLRLFVTPESTPDPNQPTTEPQTLAWPLGTDPLMTGEQTTRPDTVCVAVSGQDLSSFLAAASSANPATVWTIGASRFWIAVRPAYPNETGCSGTAP
jgi:hypothetical protein